MLQDINLVHVLEPYCKTASPRPVTSLRGERRSLEDNYDGFLKGLEDPAFWCRVSFFFNSLSWVASFLFYLSAKFNLYIGVPLRFIGYMVQQCNRPSSPWYSTGICISIFFCFLH